MTTAQPIVTDLTASTAVALDVRWSCHLTRWTDPFGALGDTTHAHGEAQLIVSLHVRPDNTALLSARLELPAGPRSLIDDEAVDCETYFDGTYLHLDAQQTNKRLLALSLDQSDQIIYAQSDLLNDAGFAPGSFDPPTVSRRGANSAMKFTSENAESAE